jgi:urease accessory protein
LTQVALPALTITQRLREARSIDEVLCLPFEMRARSRFRATLQNGEEVGVILERGQILRGGDLLATADGRCVQVQAAPESVSTVHARDPRRLARVAYHLGNRHVALEIGVGWVRYSHDHVLDDMVRGLGAEVTLESAPFEPEAGAYSHDHSHSNIRSLHRGHGGQ